MSNPKNSIFTLFKNVIYHGFGSLRIMRGYLPAEQSDDLTTLGQVQSLIGGGVSSAMVVGANLIAGDTDVAHTLGAEPKLAVFNNETGQTMVLEWEPKVGSETTEITVSSFKVLNNVSILLTSS